MGVLFDDVARTLATERSRRRALQTLVGAMLGSLVAASPRVALAQGNSQCAHFCAAVFGADTPAAGQCTSDAAHGKGLCYTCGPASTGGAKSICCARNGSGVCTSYGAATCCTAPQTCGGGGTAGVCGCTPKTCPTGVCGQISNGCGGTLNCTCGTGQICSNGQCVTPATTTTLAPTCTPLGGPCNLLNPGACCSLTCCAAGVNGCPGPGPCCCV
jgi:hypothetical protein